MSMEEIFKQLKDLQKNAYCPYSHYPVSAIVKVGEDYFNGVNVENGVYPLSVCAERNAIANAVSHGAKKIDELYLLAGQDEKKLATPCGGCRQVIFEFANNLKMPIYIFNIEGQYKPLLLEELLPHPWEEIHNE